MDAGDVILQDLLAQEIEDTMERRGAIPTPSASITEVEKASETQDKENHSQWALGGNGRFIAVGSTVPKLPAGIYEPFNVPGMWGLERMTVASDGLYTLPDMATSLVMDEVNMFWASEQKYRDHGLLYKRGVLLWGPPGSGKTVTVKLLMNDLVKNDGIVVITTNVNLTIMCLKAIRRIEPRRNLIVVFEDIDEIINYQGEATVLSMLDGENNVDNILHLATTNYPERLGARIVNRPSRFDRSIRIGMPEEAARRVYLQKATNDRIEGEQLEQWVKDTKFFSIAHLRELVAAVYCLGQPYDDVLGRLKLMAKPIKAEGGFAQTSLGFKGLRLEAGQGQAGEE